MSSSSSRRASSRRSSGRSGSPLVQPPSSSSAPGVSSSPGQVVEATTSPARGRRAGGTSSDRGAPAAHVSSDPNGPDAPLTLIWGTNINLSNTETRCKNFFTLHMLENGNPKYLDMMKYSLEMNEYKEGRMVFNIDMHDVHAFDESLYHDLVMYPVEVVQILDASVNDICEEECRNLDITDVPDCQCRLYNLRTIKGLRDLDPSQIDTLVAIRGMVIRASNVIPDLQSAVFQCTNCTVTETVNLDKGTIAEPSVCKNCHQAHLMELLHNRGTFKDKQFVRMQEAPGNVPEGETPQTVTLIAHDDLVDSARLGDRVEVVGIFRACPMRMRSTARTLKAVFKTYIDVIHYRLYKGKMMVDADPTDGPTWIADVESLTQQQREDRSEQLRAIGNRDDIYQVLLRSFAPGIHEQDDVKLGVLAQMFGGANINSKDAPNGRFRGELNVLLVGDPGVAKSQLLQYVNKIAPRGIYTSGKGSSAVGLTAYVAKDPETRELVLESGALVLSDQGICCIDEFDKMSDATRSVLHEVMEQQTISIAKAGIVCSLNARTSILAAANPVHSRYNPTLSVVENLNLPPSLLSRFDLIYLLLDKPNHAGDRRLAKHIVSMFFEDPPTNVIDDSQLDITLMSRYIAYARSQPAPQLTDEAASALAEGYVKMRGSSSGSKTITATPRQLESIIRLAEARAKMRLSEEVTKEDVEEGIRLMKVATQTAATDPVTGVIDMEIISTGRSASARQRVRDLAARIENLMRERADPTIVMADILDSINAGLGFDNHPERMITLREAREAMELLVIDEKFFRSRGEGREEVFQRAATR